MQVPYVVEWILAWCTVLSFAWKYLQDATYQFLAMRNLRQFPRRWCRIVPLVTLPQTRDRLAPQPALVQLVEYLKDECAKQQEKKDDNENVLEWSDAFVTSVLRQSYQARFLASSAMIPHFDSTVNHQYKNIAIQPHESTLLRQLQRLWPDLLQDIYPKDDNDDSTNTNKPYDITLIVPAYCENPIGLLITLTTAWKNTAYQVEQQKKIPLDPTKTHPVLLLAREGAANTKINQKAPKQPLKIQVLIVNAGGCGELEETLKGHYCRSTTTTTATKTTKEYDSDEKKEPEEAQPSKNKWADFQILSYRDGGGRGGCLNFGAQHATGRILTFLHSDTLLPRNWDELVVQGLEPKATTKQNDSVVMRPHLCAFGMGIDDTPQRGLKGGRYPPGLAGAAWQGRIRSSWCRLPYGDSVLSVTATAFSYVGGYPPNQPLLEDYELVQLFRQRAGLFPQTEQVVILPANIACSPRRWQATNVPYVALANWTFLDRYQHHGVTAEDLYHAYYGKPVESSGTVVTTEKKDL